MKSNHYCYFLHSGCNKKAIAMIYQAILPGVYPGAEFHLCESHLKANLTAVRVGYRISFYDKVEEALFYLDRPEVDDEDHPLRHFI